MKVLVILSDPPYGTERTYNGLRLASSLARQNGTDVRLFFISDAVSAVKSGQQVPTGYYNLERMIGTVLRHHGVVGVCGSCMDARGIRDTELIEGARRSSMDELTTWTLDSDRVITF